MLYLFYSFIRFDHCYRLVFFSSNFYPIDLSGYFLFLFTLHVMLLRRELPFSLARRSPLGSNLPNGLLFLGYVCFDPFFTWPITGAAACHFCAMEEEEDWSHPRASNGERHPDGRGVWTRFGLVIVRREAPSCILESLTKSAPQSRKLGEDVAPSRELPLSCSLSGPALRDSGV